MRGLTLLALLLLLVAPLAGAGGSVSADQAVRAAAQAAVVSSLGHDGAAPSPTDAAECAAGTTADASPGGHRPLLAHTVLVRTVRFPDHVSPVASRASDGLERPPRA